jgi:phage host-nuclease inhibitor protein Gam
MPSRPIRARRSLTSWQEVDLSLRRLGLISRRLEEAEAALTERLSRLKEQSLARLAPLEDERRELERQVEEFAQAHRSEMPGRSIDLNFGRLGFRRASRVVAGVAEKTLADLKRLGLTGCVRVRESLDLVALRGLPDEVLAEVGAERQVEERFFYEVTRQRLEASARQGEAVAAQAA